MKIQEAHGGFHVAGTICDPRNEKLIGTFAGYLTPRTDSPGHSARGTVTRDNGEILKIWTGDSEKLTTADRAGELMELYAHNVFDQ